MDSSQAKWLAPEHLQHRFTNNEGVHDPRDGTRESKSPILETIQIKVSGGGTPIGLPSVPLLHRDRNAPAHRLRCMGTQGLAPPISTAESKQAISPIKSGSKADVKPKNPGVEDYLSALHTYLLALAVVGSAEMQGAPAEEAFDTDTTKFVEIPWDVLQAYYFRARRPVMLVPEASRLAWLEERDTWERTVWASQFRETHRSLGQVVQSVMGGMKDHWDTQSQGMAGRANPASRPSLYQRKPGREGTYGLGCVRTRGSHHHPPRQLSRLSREGVMSVK